jgi:6-pyruvoyltetrahydropterin/6-carboxytetrahydropterin synthase
MSLHITKEFTFSASHRLDSLPDGHPCSRLHGHNYVVELELSATDRADLDTAGFVLDYRDLDEFKSWVDAEIDHRHLNDLLPQGHNPSAENLAIWLYERWSARFPRLSAVRVSETVKTWAEYRP